MTNTQRAVEYAETGGPEVLRVVDAAVPTAAPGEVVVAVEAVGINPFESKARAGIIPLPTPFPRSLGGDFTGLVRAVGTDARYFDGTPVAIGDAVLGWGDGTLRQWIAVPASHLARRPAALDAAVAGALTTPALTAAASFAVLNPGAGDTVLVSAAAGAVGFLYCQLAVAAGARVIGTASASNHERLRDIGVEPVAYGEGLADRLRALAPEGFTAVQDNVGGETIDVALALGVAPSRICEIVDHAATERLGLATPGRYERRADTLEALAGQVAHGELHLPVQAEFSLAEVQDAYRLLETRHLSGKIVVRP